MFSDNCPFVLKFSKTVFVQQACSCMALAIFSANSRVLKWE